MDYLSRRSIQLSRLLIKNFKATSIREVFKFGKLKITFMTLRQAKDTAISHNAIIELQEDEHNGFAHTVWKGVFHQLPKEYLDREFKPITDYVHYEKQYESPIIIELKSIE